MGIFGLFNKRALSDKRYMAVGKTIVDQAETAVTIRGISV